MNSPSGCQKKLPPNSRPNPNANAAPAGNKSMTRHSPSRRNFLRTTGVVGTSILLPRQVMASLAKIKKPIKLGMIADLHQDVISC